MMSDWVRLTRLLRVSLSRLMSTAPLIPGEPGLATCKPYSSSLVRLTSSSSTFGGWIGDHCHRSLAGDLVERARRGRHRGQRLIQRHVAQIDRDSVVAE